MGFQAEAQKIMALRAIAKENVRASVLKNGRMDAFEKNRVSEEREPNRTIDPVPVLCNVCMWRAVRVERVARAICILRTCCTCVVVLYLLPCRMRRRFVRAILTSLLTCTR